MTGSVPAPIAATQILPGGLSATVATRLDLMESAEAAEEAAAAVDSAEGTEVDVAVAVVETGVAEAAVVSEEETVVLAEEVDVVEAPCAAEEETEGRSSTLALYLS